MKKILSLILAAMLVISAVPMAYAADTQDYSLGTTVKYTAANNEDYTITVPAKLAPGGSGTVTLAGMWPSDATVKVTADASVDLVNSINAADTKSLVVTFAGIEKAGNNTERKSYNEAVSVANISDALFGTWEGIFNYQVTYSDGTVTPTPDPDDNNLFSFTINGIEYHAEQGMNWNNWINSAYCPDAEDFTQALINGYMQGENTATMLDKIIENGNYFCSTV